MFPLLRIGAAAIPTYGLLFIGATLAAGAYIAFRTWRVRRSVEDATYLYALSAIGAVVGAKLAYSFIEFSGNGMRSPSGLLGGSSSVGGVLGAGIGALLSCCFFGWALRPFLPQMLPALPLALAIIRIGCLCEGCCYGKPFAHGIVFHDSPVAPAGVPLFPTQIIDSIAMFLLFVTMHALSTRVTPERLAATLACCCATVRFTEDWFRGDASPQSDPDADDDPTGDSGADVALDTDGKTDHGHGVAFPAVRIAHGALQAPSPLFRRPRNASVPRPAPAHAVRTRGVSP